MSPKIASHKMPLPNQLVFFRPNKRPFSGKFYTNGIGLHRPRPSNREIKPWISIEFRQKTTDNWSVEAAVQSEENRQFLATMGDT